ncbi:MAG TPA: hypothetical protein VLE22_13940 [Bryobacteraceae bacterium]|nr:hypothetical protein [Bryobacteraceae bacterium]
MGELAANVHGRRACLVQRMVDVDVALVAKGRFGEIPPLATERAEALESIP